MIKKISFLTRVPRARGYAMRFLSIKTIFLLMTAVLPMQNMICMQAMEIDEINIITQDTLKHLQATLENWQPNEHENYKTNFYQAALSRITLIDYCLNQLRADQYVNAQLQVAASLANPAEQYAELANISQLFINMIIKHNMYIIMEGLFSSFNDHIVQLLRNYYEAFLSNTKSLPYPLIQQLGIPLSSLIQKYGLQPVYPSTAVSTSIGRPDILAHAIQAIQDKLLLLSALQSFILADKAGILQNTLKDTLEEMVYYRKATSFISYNHCILDADHIFKIKEDADRFGLHHDYMNMLQHNGIVTFALAKINQYGAIVGRLTTNHGFTAEKKTLFPSEWTQTKVKKEIFNAYMSEHQTTSQGLPLFFVEEEDQENSTVYIKTVYPSL